MLVIGAAACGGGSPSGDRASPSPSSIPSPRSITVVLKVTTTGRCCRVVTVNPGKQLTIVCFVVGFDADERYIATVLVPPKPEGRPRSSGFAAPHGESDHGLVDMPFDLGRDTYISTCRPAAWHGGAPI